MAPNAACCDAAAVPGRSEAALTSQAIEAATLRPGTDHAWAGSTCPVSLQHQPSPEKLSLALARCEAVSVTPAP